MSVAIVTGAGSGIGRACAAAFDAAGYAVVCADIDAEAAEHTSRMLNRSIAVTVDVTSPDDCDDMARTALAEFGSVDALITAAGIVRGGPPTETSVEDFRAVLDVNVVGSFLSARATARQMIAAGSGGALILVGSILSQLALPGRAAYCASKGGILMLGRALALDWADHNIRVNVIGPGIVATPMADVQLADPERRNELLAAIPAGRFAQPAEIGAFAVHLASPETQYVTGGFYPIDGGYLAGKSARSTTS